MWIALAIIAVLLVAALIFGLVRYRRHQVSLSKPEPDKSIDRSGGYTAAGGISFSQATQTPVRPPAQSPAPPPERLDCRSAAESRSWLPRWPDLPACSQREARERRDRMRGWVSS